MALITVTVRAYDRAPFVVRIPDRGARVSRLVRDDAGWKEGDHPRGKGGQFSSGQSVHVVASHHPETGNVTIHGLHGSREDAGKHQIATLQKQHAKLDRDYDLAAHDRPSIYQGAVHAQSTLTDFDQPSARTKSVEVQGKGDPSKELHLVTEGQHGGGLKIHGAYTDRAEAEAHQERLSREAWKKGGEERSEVTPREVSAARRAFNKGKPAEKMVSHEQAENQTHPAFEKFLEAQHPMDEVVPHPGVRAANRYLHENRRGDGKGGTGVIRLVTHRGDAA